MWRYSIITESVIEHVRRHPQLYDYSHPDYKKCKAKDKIWERIGREVNESGDEVKKKWRNIRDCYQKHLKCLKGTSNDPGSAAKRSYKNWYWAKQMEFFKPYLSSSSLEVPPRDINGGTNLEGVNHPPEDLSPLTDSLDDYFSEICQSPASEENIKAEIHDEDAYAQRDRMRNEERVTELLISRGTQTKRDIAKEKPTLDHIFDILKSKRRYTDPPDATDLIFLGYAGIIKTFSAKRQAIVKMKIGQIIMQEEILKDAYKKSNSPPEVQLGAISDPVNTATATSSSASDIITINNT
ncbi:hypothetical protein NQ318_014873 [Aromia moschata]|uniref:MADF domain-containing protein n=1 Tax=Aromia moschata TaxID=1265417 RepID=A0AAV8YV03_9CUCU|nr:hypothetical protein NQ318_014873 [Aromia moschata]